MLFLKIEYWYTILRGDSMEKMDFGRGKKVSDGIERYREPSDIYIQEFDVDNSSYEESYYENDGLSCPRCGSHNLSVQVVEIGQKTVRKGTGAIGNTNNLLRFLFGICTCGIGFFFWKRSEGTMRTKTQNQTFGICQSCGNTWHIRPPARIKSQYSSDINFGLIGLVVVGFVLVAILALCGAFNK